MDATPLDRGLAAEYCIGHGAIRRRIAAIRMEWLGSWADLLPDAVQYSYRSQFQAPTAPFIVLLLSRACAHSYPSCLARRVAGLPTLVLQVRFRPQNRSEWPFITKKTGDIGRDSLLCYRAGF